MTPGERDGLLEDEGTGYLISVSDLMAGLLFVFLLTLMAFVLSLHYARAQTEEARRTLTEEKVRAERERNRLRAAVIDLTNTREVRNQMLEAIRDRLVEAGIAVEIDFEHGILHLPERAVHFDTARAELVAAEEEKLHEIARVLAEVIPCYVADPPPPPRCRAQGRGRLESILLEGHTDNRLYRGERFRDNWDLSAQRAMYTYRTMMREVPALAAMRNLQGFPVFGVAGYGDGRPRIPHAEPTDDPANRRIDLRFIMTPPRVRPEILRELEEAGA